MTAIHNPPYSRYGPDGWCKRKKNRKRFNHEEHEEHEEIAFGRLTFCPSSWPFVCFSEPREQVVKKKLSSQAMPGNEEKTGSPRRHREHGEGLKTMK
ncbi:MAG: hypothetical protein KKD44_08380 [Proteobacteria bacterium]|nr:hypothetical protein [Pseudomonadota bacterium]